MGRGRFFGVVPRLLLVVVLGIAALMFAGCVSGEPSGSEPAVEIEQSDVILASTTSTEDSGLFDVLVPAFEKSNPSYAIKVVAVGTGEAITLGENKDADVLLVHAKASEEEFVAGGFGIERKDVMYNDFVIVGPEADPAGLAGLDSAADAFAAIATAEATFYSRGDGSGTHKKELALWKDAGVGIPDGAWYESTGQGMGDTLKIASEKIGYTLTDRATYLNLRDALDSVVVFEGADDLFNQYGVIVVTDATNIDGARAFSDWIISAEGQAVIESYGVETFGEPLFVPNAE